MRNLSKKRLVAVSFVIGIWKKACCRAPNRNRRAKASIKPKRRWKRTSLPLACLRVVRWPITHGAIRQAGFWLIGGHRVVSCRKLRGSGVEQRMADLPADRTETAPPFTSVGSDVFGPWMVKTRKTRGTAANAKRWGLVFTCLSSRAIHIEVLESMDASSFICALRRFFALRGPARALLRRDRGTNFVGGRAELAESLRGDGAGEGRPVP